MLEELLNQDIELKPVELMGNGIDENIECEVDFNLLLKELF